MSSPNGASVTVHRTATGYLVKSFHDAEAVESAVEALTLADLLLPHDELLVDRAARRSNRSAIEGLSEVETLTRRIAVLEHALAARVIVERAIGALARELESTPEVAFEAIRSEARSKSEQVQVVAERTLAALLPTTRVEAAA